MLDDFGDWLPLGSFAPAPETTEQLWLALGFAYMTVITGICLVVSTDVVRYRPLLLVLAAGKAASSLTALGFYLFDATSSPTCSTSSSTASWSASRCCSGRSPAGSASRPPPPEGARRG